MVGFLRVLHCGALSDVRHGGKEVLALLTLPTCGELHGTLLAVDVAPAGEALVLGGVSADDAVNSPRAIVLRRLRILTNNFFLHGGDGLFR